MFACLALLAAVTVTPTDDAWIYPHAADQVSDPYLRAWGGNEGAIGAPGPGQFATSWSLLRFEMPDLKGDITGLRLVLTHAPDPAWGPKDAEEAPLEIRWIEGDFDEDSWQQSIGEKLMPSREEKAVLAKATVEKESLAANADGIVTPRLVFDLAKSERFMDQLRALRKRPGRAKFVVAVTSRMDPEGADGLLYKFYSRAAEQDILKPRLIIETDG